MGDDLAEWAFEVILDILQMKGLYPIQCYDYLGMLSGISSEIDADVFKAQDIVSKEMYIRKMMIGM